jgi:hypothetical protein
VVPSYGGFGEFLRQLLLGIKTPCVDVVATVFVRQVFFLHHFWLTHVFFIIEESFGRRGNVSVPQIPARDIQEVLHKIVPLTTRIKCNAVRVCYIWFDALFIIPWLIESGFGPLLVLMDGNAVAVHAGQTLRASVTVMPWIAISIVRKRLMYVYNVEHYPTRKARMRTRAA